MSEKVTKKLFPYPDGEKPNFNIPRDYLSLKRTHRKRSDEIIYYMNNKHITNYVILDDCDIGYSDSILRDHFVNTHKNGFDMYKYNEALEVLKRSDNNAM